MRTAVHDCGCLVAGVVAFGIAATVAPPLRAQAPVVRPGQYEVTTELTMKGRGNLPPRKRLDCVTAEDTKDFSKKLNTMPNQGQCAVSDYKQSSNAVSYTQTCTASDGSRVTATAKMTFPTNESFHAVIDMSGTGRASAVSPLFQGSTTTITAKRVGDCTK